MSDEYESEFEGYVPATMACELSNFTLPQLRSLVGAGIIQTKRSKKSGAQMLYCVADLQRLEGAPRDLEPEDNPLSADIRALSEGWKQLLQMAVQQTKQAQEHTQKLVTSFAKPLEELGEGSRELVTAVLDQNKQLVERAAAGDAARLDFVKAAETMLKDQRLELREQNELDRKAELRREVWEGVKQAGPHLLQGFKETLGGGKLAAVETLKAKLDPAKLAAVLKFELLDSEGIDALCTALGVKREDLEAINAEADAAEANGGVPPAPEPEPEPTAEAAQ